MRTFFKWLASILFIALIPIWMLLLIPKLNGFGPDPLKDQLQQHNVYALFSQILQQSSSGSEGSQAEITDQALLVFRSALTPEYIENKSSEVIDDSAAWLTGQQEQSPSVSFNDIKEEVITAYPEAQLQIDDLTRQLKSAQQDLEGKEITPDGVPGINGDGSASSEEIAEMLKQAESLDNFASGDFRLELKSMLEPIRNVFEAYTLALPILGVLLLLLVTAMLALGSSWPSRLKWVGWVFVISATFNILLSLLFSIVILSTGLDILVGMIPTQANVAGALVRAVISSLFADYMMLESIMSGILLFVGLSLLITAYIIKRRTHTDIKSTPVVQATESNPVNDL